MRKSLLIGTALSTAFFAYSAPAFAQDTEADTSDDVIVVTIGSRRRARSAADTPAPVDVISGEDFRKNASSDIQDLLRTSVPSFNVNTQPISDAASIVRPANLRGLSPDNTLVLVNGKRRHRGSVIAFLGGGISDGAQGVDIAAIPSIALKQVEVLRDGASSQYGSDAIAGVINFVLKDASEGGTVEAQWGSTYEGDGDNYRISGNVGLPLGQKGFVNLSAEYGEVDGTVRSVIRPDVEALIAAGNTAAADFQAINTFTSEVPQYWGQPEITDDLKLFVNAGYEFNEHAELYSYANWSERTVFGGFFYRNPTNRGGIYQGPLVDPVTGAADPTGVASVLVGDLDGVGTGVSCPAGIPLTGTDGLIPDAGILGQISDPNTAVGQNCFSFVETIPGGFVPRFGGDNEDYSFALGLKGSILERLGYDISVTTGSNYTNFFLNNTLNPALGPNSPRNFNPGAYEQEETVFNLDLIYDLNDSWSIAAGAEYREEEFTITAGDPDSVLNTPEELAANPLSNQGFGTSSNGFGGFARGLSADQDSSALYVEVEGDITDAFTVQGAVRFEDTSDFGNTTDYKLAGLYTVNDNLSLRATYSTGFHTPTGGQANVVNVTTAAVGGVLQDEGTFPLNSAAGQLAADFVENRDGVRPELGPEESTSFTAGIAFNVGDWSWTVDYYDIDIDGRISIGEDINFIDALNLLRANQAPGITEFDGSVPGAVSQAIIELSNAGVINRADFAGVEDLTSFGYFANSFDTNTSGIDIVGNLDFDLGKADSSLTVAFNWNETDVTDRGSVNPISEARADNLENSLPDVKGSVTWTNQYEKIRTLVRANYFGEWAEFEGGSNSRLTEQDAKLLFDAEVGYLVHDRVELIVGANNIFDEFPDRGAQSGIGQRYPEGSPFGFNGGSYYLKARLTF